MVRCPGQDQRFWKPGDIFEVKCPGCGESIEFFKDEPKLKCRKCGQVVVNPKIDLGCAEWCQYAEQCLAVSVVRDLRIMRDKLIDDMKKVFAGDQKRIDHALSVLDYAEQIHAVEGGDPLIVRAASILHDIGIREAERKYGCSAGKYLEFKILCDADRLVNIPEEFPDKERETLQKLIDKVFKTHSGRQISVELFLETKTKDN